MSIRTTPHLHCRNAIRPLLLLSVALVALSGCAPRRTEPPPGREVTRREVLFILKQRAVLWQMYEARLRIRAQSAKARNSFQAVAVADLPERFRIEAITPFGQTAGVLVMNNDMASLFVPADRALYTAGVAQKLTAHFLGIPIPPDVFGFSLVGTIPPDQLDENFEFIVTPTRWLGVAKSLETGITYTWEFSPEPLALLSATVRGGQEEYRVQFEPPVELRAIPQAPERVLFSSPDWQLEVALAQVERPMEVPDSTFVLPFPEGVRTVNLDRIP